MSLAPATFKFWESALRSEDQAAKALGLLDEGMLRLDSTLKASETSAWLANIRPATTTTDAAGVPYCTPGASSNREALLARLVKAGWQPWTVNGQPNAESWHSIVRHGFVDTARAWLARPDVPPMAIIDDRSLNPDQLPVVIAAVQTEDVALLWEVLAQGADPSHCYEPTVAKYNRGPTGQFALQLVRTARQAELLRLHGARLDQCDHEGQHALARWQTWGKRSEDQINGLWQWWREHATAVPEAAVTAAMPLRDVAELTTFMDTLFPNGHQPGEMLAVVARAVVQQLNNLDKSSHGYRQEHDNLISPEVLRWVMENDAPSPGVSGAMQLAALGGLFGAHDTALTRAWRSLARQVRSPHDSFRTIEDRAGTLGLNSGWRQSLIGNAAASYLWSTKPALAWAPWTQEGKHPDVPGMLMQAMQHSWMGRHHGLKMLVANPAWLDTYPGDPWELVYAALCNASPRTSSEQKRMPWHDGVPSRNSWDIAAPKAVQDLIVFLDNHGKPLQWETCQTWHDCLGESARKMFGASFRDRRRSVHEQALLGDMLEMPAPARRATSRI